MYAARVSSAAADDAHRPQLHGVRAAARAASWRTTLREIQNETDGHGTVSIRLPRRRRNIISDKSIVNSILRPIRVIRRCFLV